MNAQPDRLALADYALSDHALLRFVQRTGFSEATARRDLAKVHRASHDRFVRLCGNWIERGDEEYWEGGYGCWVARYGRMQSFARFLKPRQFAPAGRVGKAVMVAHQVAAPYLADHARRFRARADRFTEYAETHRASARRIGWLGFARRTRETLAAEFNRGCAEALRAVVADLEADAGRGEPG